MTGKKGWHWPKFENVLCGTISDRERLGLPDHYFPSRFCESMPDIYQKFRQMSVQELSEITENSQFTLQERLVAGNILALVGDPRINPLDPNMIFIKGDNVAIGLDERDIESVMEQFANLGLDRKWIAKECPRHIVKLKDFKIAKYPVTNGEYRDFLLETKYPELPSSWELRRFPIERSNHPVYTVSATAADAYAAWLSQKTNRDFRLPSEAEWEYAASGASRLEFPWGNEFHPDFANTVETGIFSTTPVGIFAEGNSPFGIADMAGNVEEYVLDLYAAYPEGDFVSDHLVELNGHYRVARGGCFSRLRDLTRTKRRHGHNPKSPTYAMGFRLVEVV